MKPMLKAPGTKRSKLKYDEWLSNFAFKLNLRRYNKGFAAAAAREAAAGGSAVGRCSLMVSIPLLKAPMASALETII
jgi:hypothetical protein